MTKKILIHSLIFSPDGVSTAYLYNDIALKFMKCGYEVVVLTTTPHYNIVKEEIEKQPLKWKIWGICKQSNYQGIKVIHVPQKKFKSTILRLIGFVYWHIVSFLIAIFQKNIDIILSPSPPLTIGVLNIILGKLKKCKVVYNVQEIYPDILNCKKGCIYFFLKWIEKFVYNQSSAVVTIDQVFYDSIKERFKDRSKLHIIPNFVDTELYSNEKVSFNILDKKKFPENNSLKLMYAGNIGFAQDWKPLLSLAEKTRNELVEYYVIGEGVMKSYIEQKIRELKLSKVHVLSYQPRDLMPQLLAYSDIQFIFMNPEMDMQGFPSKVYTIMACKKPLLVCSGESTPIIKFLEDLNCAKLITEMNYNKKIDEMHNWLQNISKKQLVELGTNGVDVIQKKYSKIVVTQQYVDLINSLIR